MGDLLYLQEADVRLTLSIEEAIEIARRGLEADARGQVAGEKFYLQLDETRFIKPFAGYLKAEGFAFVKTFTYFPSQAQPTSSPATGSQVLLFDAETGHLRCLMEADWVTGLKTGASSALTAQRLAREDCRRAVVFGAGLQGELHLRALASCFNFEQMAVIDILPEKAQALADHLSGEHAVPVTAAAVSQRESLIRAADLIVTVTTGDQPLVEHSWLKPGSFVARLGSNREIGLEVITRADKLVVNRWTYVSQRVPEFNELIDRGEFGPERLHAEWLDIVAGRRPGRETPEEIIVYVALGIWGEYAALLPEIYRRACDAGLGRWI